MEYEEQLVDKDKSSIWRHFLRAKDKKSAKCKTCNKILKCEGGSTGSLHKHIKRVHNKSVNLDFDKDASSASTTTRRVTVDNTQRENPEVPSTSKKTKLTDYFESDENPTTETRVSRMIALDGIPFCTLEKSQDIRQVFGKAGHKIPKSANTIREMVVNHCDEKKKDLKKEIEKLLSEKVKFGISFDEWTSNKNRRYLSLNLHSPFLSGPHKFKNLGLIRVHGSLPASKCIQQIQEKLEFFGISLEKDIVGQTTDGCSMMVKIGKELKSLHQKCIAHAIQLALSDVFYKIPGAGAAIHTHIEEVEQRDEDDIPLSELIPLCRSSANRETSDNYNREDLAETEHDNDDGVEFTEEVQRQPFRYYDLLAKVRKVVKIFKKSPTRNEDVLQKYVTSEFRKEYCLILDSKTRWSSMADMLERFLKLKVCISKALLDINSEISFSQDEWTTLNELHEILDIIKIVVETLCRRDATLVTADVAIKYALKKLQNMNTALSSEMERSLKKRYIERRLIEAATLQYLTNPDHYFADIENDDLSVFSRPISDEMCKGIVNLVQDQDMTSDGNLNVASQQHRDDLLNLDGDDDDIVLVAAAPALTKKQELSREIEKATTVHKSRSQNNDDCFTTVKIEMTLFENGGSRGNYLSLAYEYLKAIPPTSVEPERIFSPAGYICNRLRTSLSDQSLDVISYLRSYYQEKKSRNN